MISALSSHEPAVIIDWSSAEISGVFSESTPTAKPDTPGWDYFRPVYVFRGNIRGGFGKYAHGEA